MTVERIVVPLNAASFPLLASLQGNTLSQPTDLSARLPGNFYGHPDNANYAVPQLIYCENVLPYAKGIYSVGYTAAAPAISPATVSCDQAIALRDANENQLAFVPARGANYVWNPVTSAWASVSPFTFTNALVTRAYVNGRTFICYEKTKIIEYNTTGPVFTTIALTLPAGIAITDIRGIGAASNYLLLFTTLSIYWCTPLNLLDFATTDQGAGQQIPIDIKGQITAILPCSGGFIIYTTRNAIAASFTNNGNAPFVYKEVQNCGGIATYERATQSADESGHYIWGTNGIQFVQMNKAETLFPAVTDFLAGNSYETWDTTLKQIIATDTLVSMGGKVTFTAGRYLILSYSPDGGIYTYALVYDTVLARWGKLKKDHVDVFDYTFPAALGTGTYELLPGSYDFLGALTYDALASNSLMVSTPKKGIAFLSNTGAIDLLQADFVQAGTGVAIFGRIKQRMNRKLTVLDAQVDGLRDTPTPQVTLLESTEGFTQSNYTAMDYTSSYGGPLMTTLWESRKTRSSFELAIEGSFVLANVIVKVMDHGYR